MPCWRGRGAPENPGPIRLLSPLGRFCSTAAFASGHCAEGRASQRRGRAAGSASLRRSAAARRLPCGARSWGLPHNSLRSLRSLRSDRCGESEVDARCARGPKHLRSSAPQRRSARCPATPLRSRSWRARACERRGAACEAAGGCLAQRLCGAEERRFRGQRAQRASTSTCGICLSAVNAVNVASYAAGPGTEHRRAVGPQGRPPQSERSQAPARGFAAPRAPGRGFARRNAATSAAFAHAARAISRSKGHPRAHTAREESHRRIPHASTTIALRVAIASSQRRRSRFRLPSPVCLRLALASMRAAGR